MATIIAQFKKEVRVESKKKAPFSSEGVVLWSQKQNEVPPPKKKEKKGWKEKRKGMQTIFVVECGVKQTPMLGEKR